MCVASVAIAAHPRWQLVVIGNRDEHHARAAAPLARWPDVDGPGIIAGRDLVSGGTWLGVTETVSGHPGRMVLVTNFRVPGYPQPHRPSRGGLVTSLLTGADTPDSVAIAAYNPFNLVYADHNGARLLANHPAEERLHLTPGIHGLSNSPHTTLWPKARQLNEALAAWLDEGNADPAPLLAALTSETPAGQPEAEWNPHGPDPEPRLSPVFIRNETYGTRCSSVILVDHQGHGRFIERRFDPTGAITGETELAFAW
jgi:uncharacterized protein with NRDE domain